MKSWADSEWSDLKEMYLESKTKNCLLGRKTSEVERTFQESAWKTSKNYLQTYF